MKNLLGIWKKALAVTISVLLVTTSVNIPGLVLGVEAAQEKLVKKTVVTAFEMLEEEVSEQTVTPGASKKDIKFPESVRIQGKVVTLSEAGEYDPDEEFSGNEDAGWQTATPSDLTDVEAGGAWKTARVSKWEVDPNESTSGEFRAENVGDIFSFIPVLSDKYIVDEELELPVIRVTVTEGDADNGIGSEEVQDGMEDAANADGTDAALSDPLAENVVVSEALDKSLLKAAGVKTATPSDLEKEKEIPEMPAFAASKVVDGVRITVTAEEGTFPEGAVLVVEKVPAAKEREAEAAVAEQREENQNVAVSYTFDIRVEDAEGNELQPEDGHAVQVSFSTAEIADGNLETNVYHITEEGGSASDSGEEEVVSAAGETAKAENENAGETDDTDASSGTMTAEKLEVIVDEGSETAVAETDGFSLYTVEFTYNNLQYVMPGSTEVRLTEILAVVGLNGEASAVEVSNASLFSAEKKDGEWFILSHEPFSSDEWMKVTINDIVYEITVTDAATVTTWSGLKEALGNGGEITLGDNITISQQESSDGKYLFVFDGKTAVLDLNGKTLTGGGSNAVISVNSGGKLTIKDSSSAKTGKITGGDRYGAGGALEVRGECTLESGTLSGNKAYNGGGVWVYGKFTMNGGTISNNNGAKNDDYRGDGGGVGVSSGGIFIMNNGTITGNVCGSNMDGGGVAVESGGSFTMYNGTISNNHAPGSNAWGGGVRNHGTFTMNGGEITGNDSGGYGGGVYNSGTGTFKMTNGSITGNESKDGGGVYNYGETKTVDGHNYLGDKFGTFTMTGGSITNNTSTNDGGGVYNRGKFTMSGGSITGNECSSKGGGLYVSGGRDSTYLQGTINISGNKKGTANNNVYTGYWLNISGTLSNTTPIGITNSIEAEYPSSAHEDGLVVIFTNGLNGKGNASNFTPDRDMHEVILYTDDTYTNEAAMSLKYTVTVTPVTNSHMSISSGTNPQTIVMETAISNIVYTADPGYYFPADYSSLGTSTTNNLTVTRTSDGTKITISGTPRYGSSAVNLSLAAASPISATAPTISGPFAVSMTYGYTGNTVSVTATAASGHTITGYQWYYNTTNSNTGGTAVSGATSAIYEIPQKTAADSPHYYYCVVSTKRTDNGQTTTKASSAAKVTVARRTAALSWSNTSLTYNRTSQKPTCTVSNLVSGDSCTVTVDGAQTNAGSYTATASSLSNSNYQLPSAKTTSFKINPKTVTLIWGTTTFTYNGNTQTPKATAGDVISGDTCTVTVTGGQKNAGTNYTATASSLSNSNYQLPDAKTTSFKIDPATLTVTADAKSKTYGDPEPALTYTATGFKGTDTKASVMSGNLARASGEDYGTYAISRGTLSAGNNYTISFTGATFTIDPAPLTVTAEAKSKTYGDTDPALTYTASGFKRSDTKESVMSGNLARASGEDYGTYAISRGTLSAGNNYTISFTGATFTIDPAPLTVTAEAKSKTYGDTDPALTYTASGFKRSDTKESVMSGALERAAGEDVGDYAISQGTVTAGNNYTISYTGADLKIDPAPLTVTAEAKSKTYGDTDPTLTYTASGFKRSDTKESVMSGALERAAGEDAGDYAISQGSVTAGNNYTISYTGADLKIDPAPLTVTAEAKSKIYGDTDPELTYTADGFKRTDTKETVMSGALERASGEDVGDYAISQGTVTAGNNYTISYTGADLKIDPAPLTVTAEAKSKTYGDADPALTYTATGFKRSDTKDTVMSGDLARAAGEDAGNYAISQGTVAAGNNYTISYTGADLTINKKEIGLSWGTTAFTYNGTAQAPEATATGLVGSDTCTVTVTGEQTNAGSYTATASALSNANYKLPSAVTQAFTIAKKEVKVSGITVRDKYFDNNTDAGLDYSGVVFDGLVSGDSLSVTATGTFETVYVGTRKVTISDLALGGASVSNYVLAVSGNQTEAEGKILIKPSDGKGSESGNGISERTIFANKDYLSAEGGSWNRYGEDWKFTLSDGSQAAGRWVYADYLNTTHWYYFGDDSWMRTGWLDWNGNRYYLNPVSDGTKGRMLTGWVKIGGKWYYFEKQAGKNQGRMYRNEMTPDGYRVDADGVWIP